jgi:hypothetical protein
MWRRCLRADGGGEAAILAANPRRGSCHEPQVFSTRSLCARLGRSRSHCDRSFGTSGSTTFVQCHPALQLPEPPCLRGGACRRLWQSDACGESAGRQRDRSTPSRRVLARRCRPGIGRSVAVPASPPVGCLGRMDGQALGQGCRFDPGRRAGLPEDVGDMHHGAPATSHFSIACSHSAPHRTRLERGGRSNSSARAARRMPGPGRSEYGGIAIPRASDRGRSRRRGNRGSSR